MKSILLLAASLFILLSFTENVNSEVTNFYNESSYSTIFESGSYKVGTNIDAGAYRIISKDDFGMYVVSNDANQQDIIDVSPVTTHSYIDISDDQYLQLEGVFAVPLSEISPINIENNTISTGTYSVGFDIPAGEYEVKQEDEFAIYVIYNSLDKSDILSVSPVTNNAFVELTEGQYLQLDGASITDNNLSNLETSSIQNPSTSNITDNNSSNLVVSDIQNSSNSNVFEKGELLAYMEEQNGQEFTDTELEEAMNKYNVNVLNTMFFKDIGVVEYIHEDETFELTITQDNLKTTLNAYILGLDIDPESSELLLEVFESMSKTIATDMGTNYTFSVIGPNSTDRIFIYQNGELIENNIEEDTRIYK